MVKNEGKKNFSYLPWLRNIGIIAHIDAGKTTVTERLLYLCDAIHKIGEVHKGTTQTDFLPQERERGITIQSASVMVEWTNSRSSDNKKHRINIIDTPGHVDFTVEVERSLRILDGAVVVLDGRKGVQAQTETVWQQADKNELPRIIFVNKMDTTEDEESFTSCLNSLREKLGAKPLAVQLPIGASTNLEGVVDLVTQKSYYFSKDIEEEYTVGEVPKYLQTKVCQWRQNLIRFLFDELTVETKIVVPQEYWQEFLETETLHEESLRKVLRLFTLTGEYFTVFCGSAYRHIGVKLLLDGIVDYLPSPLDRPGETVYLDGQKEVVTCENESLPYLALAFKIVFDDYDNRITYIRVYAGRIVANSHVYNAVREKQERVSTLIRMHADKEVRIEEVRAGEIAAIKNLKHTYTGDTFCDEKRVVILRSIRFPKPVISQAIIPREKDTKSQRLIEALNRLSIQDPSFRYHVDLQTRQIIIEGMGELHLQVSVDRLVRENKKHNLELTTELPKVSYRETISNTVEAWSEYKKQSGGHGHFARILLRFEPNPGGGFLFVNKIRGESVSKKFAEEVRAGLQAVMNTGLLRGYPMLDVKFTLLDGKTHLVDSSERDFYDAAVIACRENKEVLGLKFLEPIVEMVVNIPQEYMGTVLADLSSRRMLIENTEEKENGTCISGKVPLREILNYSTVLSQRTKGRGKYDTSFAYYQLVPKEVQEQILGQ